MKKNRFLFVCCLQLLFSTVVFADCVKQTGVRLDNFIEDRASCKSTSAVARNYPKCMLNAVIRYTETSCLPSQKASGKVLQILWQDFDNIWSGKNLRMTREQFSEELDKRAELIREEERLGVKRMDDELDAIFNSKRRSINDANLNNLIDALGGIVTKNSTDIFTYTYRGRTTTCTTVGNIVNCN